MVETPNKASTIPTNPAHHYALRRLSARASTHMLNPPIRPGHETLTNILTHLNNPLQLQPGLTEPELTRLEAELNLTFPPELKPLLAAGFFNWQSSAARDHLRAAMQLPAACICMQVLREHAPLWCKTWGPRPSLPEKALKLARKMLKKSPLLIPIFKNCYLPCKPCLAGNPVFFIDENEVFVCGIDLFDFLKQVNNININDSVECTKRILSKTTRWVEFWSDVVFDSQRNTTSKTMLSCFSPESVLKRTSSVSSLSSYTMSFSSPERSECRINEPPTENMSNWMDEYVMGIGSVMRKGGWSESETEEIVHVSSSGIFEEDIMVIDNEVVRDALLLKVSKFAEVLRKGGWSCEDVSDALGLKFWSEDKRKVVNNLSPEFAEKIRRKLADSISGL